MVGAIHIEQRLNAAAAESSACFQLEAVVKKARQIPANGINQFIIRVNWFFGSLSIVGVGFVKIPPQFYEKGPFYVQFQVLLILGMLNKPPHYRPFYPMMYSEVSGFGTV